MRFGGAIGVFHRVSIWIMRIAYLNLLWILFTVIGLVVFGIGPATLALFVVARKLVLQEEDVAIFSTFVSAFRSNLFNGNLLFYLYAAMAAIAYFDVRYFGQFDGFVYDVITTSFIILSFLLFLSFCFIGTVFSHYQLSFFEYVRVSFVSPFLFPLQSLWMLIGLFFCMVLYSVLPGVLPFFSTSLPVFIITAFAQKGFKKHTERAGAEKAAG